MPRRFYRTNQQSLDFVVDRGWAFSKKEFSDYLGDAFDEFHQQRRPFVVVIQPRQTAQVEFSTAPLVDDDASHPIVSQSVMDQIDQMVIAMQKRSRSRNKDRNRNPTGGTYHGLQIEDAKALAKHLVKVLDDPETFRVGKIAPLFESSEGDPAA